MDLLALNWQMTLVFGAALTTAAVTPLLLVVVDVPHVWE